jgi:hypothetical protein
MKNSNGKHDSLCVLSPYGFGYVTLHGQLIIQNQGSVDELGKITKRNGVILTF